MTIQKCNRCGAEIRELPETQAIFPKYYIYKYSSPWLTKEDIDLCQDCTTRFTEWLENKDDDEKIYKLKEELSKLAVENIHLINQIKLNEAQQNNQCMLVENEMKYYEKQKHWFRNFVEKIFRRSEQKMNNEEILERLKHGDIYNE